MSLAIDNGAELWLGFFSTALYLLGVMIISALTLICSVLVISIHHYEPDRRIPPWVDRFIFGYLARAIGVRNTRVNVENAELDGDYNKVTNCSMFDQEGQDDDINDVKTPKPDEKRWSRLAYIFDKIFFMFFLCFTLILTVGMLCVCIKGIPQREKPLTGYGYVTEDHRT